VKSVVLVPTAAIQRSPQTTFVWVVKPDATVELRNVSVQLTEGDQAAIANGLSEGERVVVDGVDKLQPGSKVVVGTPGAPGGAGAAGPGGGGAGAGSGSGVGVHKGKGKAAS
jgi:multidrug efflux system membrane fusion protein